MSATNRMRVAAVIAFWLLLATHGEAQQTTTFTIDCWDDIYPDNSCVLCGGPGKYNSNRYYPNGPYPGEPWHPTCGYADPLSPSVTFVAVTATLFIKNCSSTVDGATTSPLTFNATLNGVSIATPITITTYDCNCNGDCMLAIFSNAAPDFQAYEPGGYNVFGIDVTQGTLALDHVDLTISYFGPERISITSLEPYVPTGSTVVSECILYHAPLTGVVTNNGTPAPGKIVILRSDRNTPPPAVDTLAQPSQPSAADGRVEGAVETRKRGIATISSSNITTSSPATIQFQEATYQSVFEVTTYFTPLESEYTGPSVTNPCGLVGTFRKKFLSAVKLEGSGVATNGVVIQYSGDGCYHTDTCPRTSTGVCAQAGVTLAVDPTVIPYSADVLITGVGARTAQDTGGAVVGYHVDNYVGIGSANYSATTLTRAIRFIQGDSSCAQ